MITGETLRAIRNARSVKQTELSQLTGIVQPYISDIERGKRIITQEQETAILAALDVNDGQALEITLLVREIQEASRIESTGWNRINAILEVNANE